MTSAGWYPDPAGTPNTYRYWDGQSWSQATSTDPFGQQAPPAAPTPQPPPIVPPAPPAPPVPPVPQPVQQSYGALPGAPQWSPMPGVPTPAPAGGSATGRTIAIVTAAVAFLVLLAIIAFVAVRTLGDDGSPSAQVPAATDTPTPSRTEPNIPGTSPKSPLAPAAPLGTITPTATECYGGLTAGSSSPSGTALSGGGLTVPRPKGYRAMAAAWRQFTFAGGAQAAAKSVSSTWASTIVVGALPRSSGYTGLEQAARAVAACVANNPLLYTGVTSISDLSAKPITVDGHRAFSLMQDIKVDTPTTTATGDTAQVVVVDTGNKRSYGVFMMVVPVGDKAYLALQKSTAAQLRVG